MRPCSEDSPPTNGASTSRRTFPPPEAWTSTSKIPVAMSFSSTVCMGLSFGKRTLSGSTCDIAPYPISEVVSAQGFIPAPVNLGPLTCLVSKGRTAAGRPVIPSVMRMGVTLASSVVVSAEPGVRAGFSSGEGSVSRYKSTPAVFNTVISRYGPGFGGVPPALAPLLKCTSGVVIRSGDPDRPPPPPRGGIHREKVPQTTAVGAVTSRMWIFRIRNDSASPARPLSPRIPAKPL